MFWRFCFKNLTTFIAKHILMRGSLPKLLIFWFGFMISCSCHYGSNTKSLSAAILLYFNPLL